MRLAALVKRANMARAISPLGHLQCHTMRQRGGKNRSFHPETCKKGRGQVGRGPETTSPVHRQRFGWVSHLAGVRGKANRCCWVKAREMPRTTAGKCKGLRS